MEFSFWCIVRQRKRSPLPLHALLLLDQDAVKVVIRPLGFSLSCKYSLKLPLSFIRHRLHYSWVCLNVPLHLVLFSPTIFSSNFPLLFWLPIQVVEAAAVRASNSTMTERMHRRARMPGLPNREIACSVPFHRIIESWNGLVWKGVGTRWGVFQLKPFQESILWFYDSKIKIVV